MNRRIAPFLIVIALMALLTACGSSSASSTTAGPAQPAAPTPAAIGASPVVADATQTAPTDAAAPAAPTDAAAPTAQSAGGTAGSRTFHIVPEQTEARYEVQEQFLNRDLPNKAVGKTNAVEGSFDFSADGKPTGQVSKITVDLRTLTSDQSRRDQWIRRQSLASNQFPFAEFSSTGVEGVPESYAEGQDVTFKLLGNMTIHGVTRPVTFDVRGKLVGDTVTGTATTSLLMKDFGFDPPNIAGLLSVQDGVTVTVDFTAKEGA